MLLKGFLIGFMMAAVPGAVFIEVIRRTIARGLEEGLKVAMGEFVGHVATFGMIFAGLGQLISRPPVQHILSVLGIALLVWLGTDAILARDADVVYDLALPENKSFWVGFGLSISDPSILGLWLLLSTSLPRSVPLALTSIGVTSLGFLVFFAGTATILNARRQSWRRSTILWLSQISGIFLLIFALLLMHRLLGG